MLDLMCQLHNQSIASGKKSCYGGLLGSQFLYRSKNAR